MKARLATAAAAVLVVSGCGVATLQTTADDPEEADPTGTTTSPSRSAAPEGDHAADWGARRDRLRRDLRRTMVVDFLDESAEALRGDSMIDGVTLEQALAGIGDELAPDDDVYTARLTSLVAGRHHADGTFEPMFDHLHTWVLRRHHFMEASGCGAIRSPESCQPCAWFYDLADFFVPKPGGRAHVYGATVRPEAPTGTEGAEAEAAGMEPCR